MDVLDVTPSNHTVKRLPAETHAHPCVALRSAYYDVQRKFTRLTATCRDAHPSRVRSRDARERAKWRRVSRAAIVLAQSLALVLGLQLSGIAHQLADAVMDTFGAHEDEAPCDAGDDDRDCPPGCPACHACAHAQSFLAPRAGETVLPPLLVVTAPPLDDVRAPTSMPPSNVYRPPRA